MRLSLETVADKVKAIGVILAFIVGTSAVIVRYYNLPKDVASITAEQKVMRAEIDKLTDRLETVEKRISRRRVQ